MTTEAWITALRAYKGAAFHFQGCTPSVLDCVGLLTLAAEDIDKPLARLATYTERNLTERRVIDGMAANFIRRPYNRLQPVYTQIEVGDILVLFLQGQLHPQHLAVYTGNKQIIHADARHGKVIEERFNTRFWAPRIHSVWHW